MINSFKISENSEIDLEFQKALTELSASIDESAFRAVVKNRLLKAINEKELREELPSLLTRLLRRLRHIFIETRPESSLRVVILERVVRSVSRRRERFFMPSLFHSKAAWSAFFLLVFVTTIVFNFTIGVKTVNAAQKTYLDDMSGRVEIVRKGELIIPVARFELKTEDTIRTFDDAGAAIYFLDDSIARLAENTEVTIDRLFVSPFVATETLVEIDLASGRVWSKVLNLVDKNAHFQVKSHSTVATARAKATFAMAADGKKTEVVTYQNNVDVTVQKFQTIQRTSVVKGHTATIEEKTSTAVIRQQESGKQSAWVKENLVEDKAYVVSLMQEQKEERRKMISALPVKEISISAQNIFAFDPSAKVDGILSAASLKLVRAEIAIEDGDTLGAQKFFDQYTALLNEFSQVSEQMHEEDLEKYVELRKNLDEHLAYYRKQFTVLLPTEDTYALKEMVQTAALQLAETDVERSELKIASAGEKLHEAEELSEQGEVALASEQLQAYSQAVEEVVTAVKELSSEDKVEVVAELLDQRSEDFNTLKAISAVHNTPAVTDVETTTVPVAGSSVAEEAFVATEISGVSAPLTESPLPETGDTAFEKLKQDAKGKLLLKTVLETVAQESTKEVGKAVLEVENNSDFEDKGAMKEKIEDLAEQESLDITLQGNAVTVEDPFEGVTVIRIDAAKGKKR